jgi:predicted Zn-dependent protease
MSTFITATQINMMTRAIDIAKSYAHSVSGVYPTESGIVYIVSTSGEDLYQTVNVLTRNIESTTQADFRDFVEGKL